MCNVWDKTEQFFAKPWIRKLFQTCNFSPNKCFFASFSKTHQHPNAPYARKAWSSHHQIIILIWFYPITQPKYPQIVRGFLTSAATCHLLWICHLLSSVVHRCFLWLDTLQHFAHKIWLKSTANIASIERKASFKADCRTSVCLAIIAKMLSLPELRLQSVM